MSGIRKAAKVARWGAATAFLLVAWMSLAPDFDTSDMDQLPIINALAHVVMYFIMTICILTGWYKQLPRAVPTAALIAACMEAGQIFVPGRNFDMIELTGNLLGFGLGWAFFLSLRQLSRDVTL